MKRVLLTVIIAAIFALASCVGLDTIDSVEAAPEVVFKLETNSIGYNVVKVLITHSGTNRDQYVIFSTEDLTSSIDELCQRYIADNELSEVLLNQKKKIYPIRNLSAGTEYRIIAAGITAEGVLYGEPADLRVVTTNCPWTPEFNEAWRFTYLGEFSLNEYDAYSGVRIDVNEECKDVFCLRAYKKDYFDACDNISDIIEDTVAAFIEDAEWNWWDASTYIYRTSTTTFWSLYENDWVIVAAGLNEEGIPTGKYSVSPCISPKLEDTAPRYCKWLGEWCIKGTDVILTFKSGRPNSSFNISGWNGLSEEIKADYDPVEDAITISCQYVTSFDVEYSGVTEDTRFYLRGLILNSNGNWNFSTNNEAYNIAKGEKNNNQITLTGVSYIYDSDVIFESMGFIGKHTPSEKYIITHNRKDMVFPLTLEKI